MGPVHGSGSIRGNRAFIGKILPTGGCGTSGITPQDGGKLLPGNGIVWAKIAVWIAGDDSIGRSPAGGICIIGRARYIREIRTAGHSRASSSTVKDRSNLSPAGGGFGREGSGAGAAHQAMAPNIGHSIRIPRIRRNIGKACVTDGGKCGSVHCQQHDNCKEHRCKLF